MRRMLPRETRSLGTTTTWSLVAMAIAVFAIGGRVAAQAIVFEAFCGHPRTDTDRPDAYNWRFEHSFARLQSEPDDWSEAPPGCPPARAALLEQRLEQAMGWYLSRGFPAPASDVLGPVVPMGGVWSGPKTHVRVYLNDAEFGASERYDSNGAIYGMACDEDRAPRPSLPFIRFTAYKLAGASDTLIAMIAAHELAHVLQQDAPLWRHRTRCFSDALWVMEGIAAALAAAFTAATFPGHQPLFPYDPDLLLGGRSYRTSLDAADGRIEYDTGGFWLWLVERFGRGDVALLHTMMQTPMQRSDAPDWIGWLDAGMEAPNGPWGIGASLTVQFPSFLAAYAEWGTTRWPHVGDVKWRRYAFLGEAASEAEEDPCPHVELSAVRPSATVWLTNVASLSGRCVSVRVAGEGLGHAPVRYDVRARSSDSLENVDDLHLRWVSYGGTTVFEQARCHRDEARVAQSDRLRHVPACDVPIATALRETDPRWARAWTPNTRSGGGWTDVLVFARARAGLTDATHAAARPRNYEVEFSLVAASVPSFGPTYGGANQAAPGTTRMPVVAGSQPTDVGGDEMSRFLSGQLAPGAPPPLRDGAPGGGEGLYAVHLMEADDIDGDDVGRSLSAWPRHGSVPYGATGTFPGWVITGVDLARAASGEDPTLGSFTDDATVTVHTWTDGSLHVTLVGTWCYVGETAMEAATGVRRCGTRRDLHADLWLGFGDTFDDANPYVAIDSPVQALYRDAFDRAMGGGAAGTDPGGASSPVASDGGPSGDPPDAAIDGFTCECTCAGLESLEREAATIDDGGVPDLAVVGAITQCALRCSAAFATCE